MKHHLTFKDDKSDKFWQIEVSGKSFTVTYGKTGSAGTSQTKSFDSETECLREAEKLLAEKKKKGYQIGNGSENLPQTEILLSDQFFNYLKTQIEAVDKGVAAKLAKANWNTYARHAYNSILTHWGNVQKKTKQPVGSFIVGWNDGEDNGIDIDYVESNDIDFYDDGATAQLTNNVIDFSDFFKKVLKSEVEEIQDEEFFSVVKDLLCKLTQEIVEASTTEKVFEQIPKKSPCKIWFYHWHDEEMMEIYDSKEGPKLIDGYQREKDSRGSATKVSLNSFYSKYRGIEIDGNVPENIGKASAALSAKIKTQDEELPVGFGKLINLQSLEITINKVQKFPQHICDFVKLERLSFEAPLVSAISKEIANLKQLEKLSVRGTNINQFPNTVGELKKLKTIKLMYNPDLESLPKEIGGLAELQDLSVINCKLAHLDEEIFNGSKLNSLDFSQTQLSKLPETIGSLRWLRTLYMDGTEISSLPDSIFDLKKLSYISLKGSKFTAEKVAELSEKFKSNRMNVTICLI